MLAAVEKDLGTCWIGSFNEGDVARIVNFPFEIRPVAMITIGYPADKPKKRQRRSLDRVVFWESYKDM